MEKKAKRLWIWQSCNMGGFYEKHVGSATLTKWQWKKKKNKKKKHNIVVGHWVNY
jgi:hypothetical protein